MSANAPSLTALVLEEAGRRLRRLRERFLALSAGRRALVVSGGGAVILVAGLLVRAGTRSEEIGEARVIRGPLRITVALSGTLAPEHAETYGPEVPGAEMKILELAPDGERVNAGTRLIRFDDAPFRRELEHAEGDRVKTESESEQARQALAALEATRRGQLAEAEAAVERSDLDLKTFVNGTSPLSVQQSTAAVEKANREAEDAKIKFEGLEPFAQKGYVSREELRAARLRMEQAEADRILAERQHATLVGYANPQQVAQKTAELAARREALKNERAKGDAQTAQARAALGLAEARALEARRAVTEARRRLELCEVKAKSPGLVVWREVFEKSGERRKVRVGDSVFAGQPVVDLPDLSEMLLMGRIREGDVHHVGSGQKTEIRLDAFPGRTFEGSVVRLGALTSGEKSETRSFPLVVKLAAVDPLFRPGMTGRAVVLSGDVPDALQVPVDAVRYEGDEAWCVTKSLTGGTRKTKVTTGKSNAFYVEVKSGLKEGDVVLIGR